MSVQLTLHTDEILQQLDAAVVSTLNTAGQAAVSAVHRQMLSGYAHPIRSSGRLMESITFTVNGRTLCVGTPLDYAPAVHDGTARAPGRPFLQDGMHAADLPRVVADALTNLLF